MPEERKAVYRRCRRSRATTCPTADLPVREVRGHKKGLQGFKPNVNVRMNTWNSQPWYWAPDRSRPAGRCHAGGPDLSDVRASHHAALSVAAGRT